MPPAPHPRTEPHREYALTSDLARLSLPQAFQDSSKLLGWVDSILLLFVTIGVVGIYQPEIFVREITPPTDTVPVVFTPPDEPPPAAEPPPEQMPEARPNEIPDQPAVVTRVAVNTPAVLFSVPVKGATEVVKEARYATAPPPNNIISAPPPPAPTTFNYKTAGSSGRFPDPTYPRQFLQARQQGKVLLNVVVDPSGAPTTVEIRESSGHPQLDRHGADWVRDNWRWLPGEKRYYLVPLVFQIR